MRFRLSSVFLWFVIVGLCLGWAADHMAAGRISLLGTWRYPTDDAEVMGYWSNLTFHRDGRFEKEQKHRTSSVTYSGTYTCEGDGTLVFHVTRRSFRTWFRQEPQTTSLDERCSCRYAIDRSGHLLIKERGHRLVPLFGSPMAKTVDVNDKSAPDHGPSVEAAMFDSVYALKWEVHQRCN